MAQDQEDQHPTEHSPLLPSEDENERDSSTLPKKEHTFFEKTRWRELALFIWALLASTTVILLAVALQHSQKKEVQLPGRQDGGSAAGGVRGKRNLIFMVSDGMGPSSLSLTRSWHRYTTTHAKNNSYDGHDEEHLYDDYGDDNDANLLVLDDLLIGQSRTRSASSLITDSAAGATAFSCGRKTFNGAISMNPVGTDLFPCGSVMEAAKKAGYTTGLVVTTRVTDATPAVFVAHVPRREMEDDIAGQMVGRSHLLGHPMVDLIFGGGRCHFLPVGQTGSCRGDEVDMVDEARRLGWNYIHTKDEFDEIDPTDLDSKRVMPLLGLFASHDLPFEIDRRFMPSTYPSLEAMTRKALSLLAEATKDSEKGFFVLIEGSRIDHAGHENDPAAQVHEVLEYDRTVRVVLEFIEESDTPTLMVATSDHETGGLAVARQLTPRYPEYVWYPGILANVSRSARWTAHEYHEYLQSLDPSSSTSSLSSTIIIENKVKITTFLRSLIKVNLGIPSPEDSELSNLLDRPVAATALFAAMISRRAQVGWSTHGHSAADVNLYSSSSSSSSFKNLHEGKGEGKEEEKEEEDWTRELRGVNENTDIGNFLSKWLDVQDHQREVDRMLLLQEHSAAASMINE